MAIKLNIRPDIEKEMDLVLATIPINSKTEYINQAIRNYNRQIKRSLELKKLKSYFKDYEAEAKSLLSEFTRVTPNSH